MAALNVLIVGSGKGSWQMRGLQVGAALGARVTSTPSIADWQWADVCILLKRAAVTFAGFARQYRVPIIWDVLDLWKQPTENIWTIEQGRAAVTQLSQVIRPAVMIGATKAMASDIGGVYIPHHCWTGLMPAAARESVTTVAYDGSARYLGEWWNRLDKACRARGWRFVVGPPDLAAVDLLVAFRDGEWNGPLCREWKSGVKYVNALQVGRPIITMPCAAWYELAPTGEAVIDPHELGAALDKWADPVRRHAAADASRAVWSVDEVVRTYYQPLLEQVRAESSCAA